MVHRENDVIILALKHKMRARVGGTGGNKRAANEYTKLAIGVVVLGSSDDGVNLVFVLRYSVRRFTKTPPNKNKKNPDAETQRRFKSIWDRHYWRTIIEQCVISRRRVVVKRGEMGSANKMVKHHHGAASNPARANTTAREGLQTVLHSAACARHGQFPGFQR